MKTPVFALLLVLFLFSCEEDSERDQFQIAGQWEITIFQFLSIEDTDVLEDNTLQNIGTINLDEGGTGTIQFKSSEPWGYTSSMLKWSLEGEVLKLEIANHGLRIFELNVTFDGDQIALTEMITEAETENNPHRFQMTTLELQRIN